MIGALRHKFVIIVMVLVGTVLAFMIGSSLWSTYTTQWQLIDRSLASALESDTQPMIGGSTTSEPSEYSSGGRLVVSVTLDDSGVLLTSNESLSSINQNTLDDVISVVLSSDDSTGRITSSHVAWASETLPDGSTKIAIAASSDIDYASRHQLFASLLQPVSCSLLPFPLAWWLSAWLL